VTGDDIDLGRLRAVIRFPGSASGLTREERLVVDGQFKLRPGAKVAATLMPTTPPGREPARVFAGLQSLIGGSDHDRKSRHVLHIACGCGRGAARGVRAVQEQLRLLAGQCLQLTSRPANRPTFAPRTRASSVSIGRAGPDRRFACAERAAGRRQGGRSKFSLTPQGCDDGHARLRETRVVKPMCPEFIPQADSPREWLTPSLIFTRYYAPTSITIILFGRFQIGSEFVTGFWLAVR
jgi:hypothetical protein